MEDRVI